MEEIKVGEYIRTIYGRIGKVIDVQHDSEDIYRMTDSKRFFYLSEHHSDEVKSHSPNIIALIEVGDYVNGRYIQKITSQLIYFRNCAHTRKDSLLINDIVTKEQFNSMKYIVGGKEK